MVLRLEGLTRVFLKTRARRKKKSSFRNGILKERDRGPATRHVSRIQAVQCKAAGAVIETCRRTTEDGVVAPKPCPIGVNAPSPSKGVCVFKEAFQALQQHCV
ncbi:hypothetical protein E2C01_067239 [Portunus trituberculatus]|uniref:Uncharacterized protein n=1 Tax=Portunus trituberculatus TaxID=210409 RepID=A0A5B7HT37_PORTR|nr:hypothetical protein [Portunus trituberculatus]